MKMKKGFTLIELIIVMSIIAILAIASVSSYTNSLKISRDNQRKSDLRKIMTALQVYYTQYGKYPPPGGVCSYGSYCFVQSTAANPWIPSLDTNYISSLPKDPLNNGNYPWVANGYTYVYGNVSLEGQTFDLLTQLENKNDDDRCKLKNYLKSDGVTSWCPSAVDDPTWYIYKQSPPLE
jgi:general secretion pathway protein G